MTFCVTSNTHHSKLIKLNVKCTLVQALRLCTGCTAHRGSRGIALPFHDHGTRWGVWGASVTSRPLFTPGKDLVPILQEAGWAPGPVWTGAENLAPTGIRPRTIQPVVSRYTGYATWPTKVHSADNILINKYQTFKDFQINLNYISSFSPYCTENVVCPVQTGTLNMIQVLTGYGCKSVSENPPIGKVNGSFFFMVSPYIVSLYTL